MNVENADKLTISSDDIFWMPKSPGKTLIVGAGYVALECGGFLNAIGLDVTIAVRSILLRGFDRDFAEAIGKDLEKKGVKFLFNHQVKTLNGELDGKKVVTFQNKAGQDVGDETEFDTVMVATGRLSEAKHLNLDKAGVKVNKWGYVEVNNLE